MLSKHSWHKKDRSPWVPQRRGAMHLPCHAILPSSHGTSICLLWGSRCGVKGGGMAVWPHTGCYRAFLAAVTGLSPPGLKQGSHLWSTPWLQQPTPSLRAAAGYGLGTTLIWTAAQVGWTSLCRQHWLRDHAGSCWTDLALVFTLPSGIGARMHWQLCWCKWSLNSDIVQSTITAQP